MKFHSKALEEHVEVPLADEGRLDELLAHFSAREAPQRVASEDGNACYVLSVHRGGDSNACRAQLGEIRGLVLAQGDQIVGSESHLLVRPDARTLIRRGVADRVGADAIAAGADLLVVDAELSPSQTRNLEDAVGLPVCDREAVILNVFERHATTRRARMQVEIAHLEYLRPRIRGIGLNMDQQAGGIMGARGPGETASELLARGLDGRLAGLRRALLRLEQADGARRRPRSACARIALVGYTNAGKTSLMNALTSAGLSVRDRPFETLDTTSRSLSRHGGDVLLSDTVGFIRRLPERLFASFESTLAEVAEASLLVLVVDAADPEMAEHLRITARILEKIGAHEIPRFVVFNKIDRVGERAQPDSRHSLCDGHDYAELSSRDVTAVAELRERLLGIVRAHHELRQIFVPYERSELTRLIYARCRVHQTTATPTGTQFVLEGEAHVVHEIAQACRSKR